MTTDERSAPPPPVFTGRRLDAGGIAVRCAEGGRGPVVVSLGADPAAAPDRLHERLAERHRVVVLDVLGAGLAGDAPAVDLAAGAIEGALAAMGVDRFGLIGESLAAPLAVALARRHADRVDALVLISPALGATSAPARDRGADRPERPGDLATPTLVLLGTRDRTTPPEATRRAREGLAGAHVMFVYDAGRHVGGDRPEAVASLVADFLERREQFVVSRERGARHP